MKSVKPKISIIIPVYNVEKYLRRCLDSVKDQTFQDWVAICVDDGSPDKSGKILDEYAKKDKRFIVIHKKNGGVSSARNDAMKKIKTPYIMFLDSDDCIHPQAMEIIYSLIEENHADIVSFRYIHTGSSIDIPDWFKTRYNKKNIKVKITNNLLKYTTNRYKSDNSWLVQQCMIWQHMYRFDFIKSVRFVSGISVLEDFIFWSNVLFRKPRAIITKIPLYSYTENTTSILHTVNYYKSCIDLINAAKFANADFKKLNISWINRRRWRIRFLWEVLACAYMYIKHIDDKDLLKDIRNSLMVLEEQGVFDNPPDFHAMRYKRRIEKFISQIS